MNTIQIAKASLARNHTRPRPEPKTYKQIDNTDNFWNVPEKLKGKYYKQFHQKQASLCKLSNLKIALLQQQDRQERQQDYVRRIQQHCKQAKSRTLKTRTKNKLLMVKSKQMIVGSGLSDCLQTSVSRSKSRHYSTLRPQSAWNKYQQLDSKHKKFTLTENLIQKQRQFIKNYNQSTLQLQQLYNLKNIKKKKFIRQQTQLEQTLSNLDLVDLLIQRVEQS